MRPLFCLLFCAASFAAETVTLRADVYPPFNTVPGDKPGVMIEVAQAVFAKSGITVDYKPMPWSRSLKLVEAGEVDGAVGADPGMAETFALSTVPQAWWDAHFFTLAGQTWTYQGMASLEPKRLGVAQDYSYGKGDAGEDIDAYIAAGKGVSSIKGDKPIEILLGMLQRDRIDVLIESPAVIKASLAGMKLPFEAVRDAGTYSKGYGLHIAFTKNDRGRRLAKMLGDGTVELRTSGELKKILERYEMSDWVGR
jgi:polar amino acid transport system substrate-binding protein